MRDEVICHYSQRDLCNVELVLCDQLQQQVKGTIKDLKVHAKAWKSAFCRLHRRRVHVRNLLDR